MESILKLLLLCTGVSLLFYGATRTIQFEANKKHFLAGELQTRRCASIDAGAQNIEVAAENLKKRKPELARRIEERFELLNSYFLDLWLRFDCNQKVQNNYILKTQTHSNLPNIVYILNESTKL